MATATARGRDVSTRFEPVIGLEVHAQLSTATKIFCGCRNRFGDAPNTNVCPVCLGLPGALPVLSREAVTLALRAALATHCTVHETSVFARKNYFYPDLPKGYQISQYERPLATDGHVEIPSGGALRRVRLARGRRAAGGRGAAPGWPRGCRRARTASPARAGATRTPRGRCRADASPVRS